MSITDPSGQVWVLGVVAHAETATVATIISASRFICLSLSLDSALTTMPWRLCSQSPIRTCCRENEGRFVEGEPVASYTRYHD